MKKKYLKYSWIIIFLLVMMSFIMMYGFSSSSQYCYGFQNGYAFLSFSKLKCTIVFSDIDNEQSSKDIGINDFPLSGVFHGNLSNAAIWRSFGKDFHYNFRYYPLYSKSIWDVNNHKIEVMNAGKKIVVDNQSFDLIDNHPVTLVIIGNQIVSSDEKELDREGISKMVAAHSAYPKPVSSSQNGESNNPTNQN
ncbi:MAG: hypothetical protein FWC50_01705 [Planctomycetaceae bacterium]|nr:hypothetical protein [Planctomycetaceae bacterium]